MFKTGGILLVRDWEVDRCRDGPLESGKLLQGEEGLEVGNG